MWWRLTKISRKHRDSAILLSSLPYRNYLKHPDLDITLPATPRCVSGVSDFSGILLGNCCSRMMQWVFLHVCVCVYFRSVRNQQWVHTKPEWISLCFGLRLLQKQTAHCQTTHATKQFAVSTVEDMQRRYRIEESACLKIGGFIHSFNSADIFFSTQPNTPAEAYIWQNETKPAMLPMLSPRCLNFNWF